MKKQWVLLAVLAIIACNPVVAKVTLPAIISDNMVLQQDARVNIWGKAEPGETITIKPSWATKAMTTIASGDGKWTVKLKTPRATMKKHSITVSGENTITVSNILIGEVWLCGGQSNMLFPVGKQEDVKWQTGMEEAEKELQDANYPEIRFFTVPYCLAPDGERDDCEGKWLVCTAESTYNFSAVGFVFGRRLFNELHTPVGLILSAKGDTHVESWTKMDVMKNNPLYTDVFDEFGVENVKQNKLYKVPSTLWNGMIKPILGYTVKGTIWYQGEANAMRHAQYQQVFTNMINSWRKEWEQPDMPFYFVQIAPFKDQPAGIREAQLQTWQGGLKNLGMVVTTDVGDSLDIHPRNKRVPGERLALWALAKQYGKNIAYSGPLFKSMKLSGNKLILSFDYADNGLMTPNNELVKGFYIAGADQQFYPSKAIINGSCIEVFSSQVQEPVAVRYAFANFFRANLYNKEGLPATPFRSDSWSKK